MPLKNLIISAGWSSPVARQAHNLKVVGSNPTPATNYSIKSISYKILKNFVFGVFLRLKPDNDYRVANKVANKIGRAHV